MNTLDFIIIIPILYGLVRGFFRGLVGELTAIVAIVIAIICAKLYAPAFSIWLLRYIVLGVAVAEILAYIIIFLGIALVLNLLGGLIKKVISAISLGWLNRLLGAIFGTLKWALIISVVLNGVAMLNDVLHFISPELQEHSLTYNPIKSIASVAWDEVQNL